MAVGRALWGRDSDGTAWHSLIDSGAAGSNWVYVALALISNQARLVTGDSNRRPWHSCSAANNVHDKLKGLSLSADLSKPTAALLHVTKVVPAL